MLRYIAYYSPIPTGNVNVSVNTGDNTLISTGAKEPLTTGDVKRISLICVYLMCVCLRARFRLKTCESLLIIIYNRVRPIALARTHCAFDASLARCRCSAVRGGILLPILASRILHLVSSLTE